MRQPELFDVIIVAARGAGPAAAAQLVQTVARRFGLAPGTVALGLERGGIEIHRGLVKSEAIAATRALHELGAVAEVRAARDASGILMIEPDADAAPSGSGDVPGAPPFGVMQSTSQRSDAPLVERSDAPLVERSREPLVERSRVPVVEPPRAAAPVVEPLRTQPPIVVPPQTQPRARPAAAPVASAARSTAASGVPLDAHAPAISREALGDAPVASRFVPPGAHERVELDLVAAGLTHAPVGASAIARGRSEAIATPGAPPPPSALETGATSGRYPADSMRAAASLRAPTAAFDDLPKSGLLASDRVLSILMAACVGAVLGLIIAFGWVRGDTARACERLEGELQAAVADPIGVEEGRARTPETIARQLEGELDDQRGRFFSIWALVALPITAAGAIPRPER